ncbi:MAG: tRNA pseudouridine(55) synthase TruB [Rhodocyclaceae bacterium]
MIQKPRRPKLRVDGVLLLDKPQGLTSNGALQSVRRLFQAAKAGHTGTLDPLATGLLPVCFGEATKFSQGLFDADKRYRAGIALGVRTDTADAEGAEIAHRPVLVTRQQVEAALARFVGEIDQVPPMYSALKRGGRPLYELARQGVEVERAPRRVHIYAIDLGRFDGEALEIEVHCSKGTYIRTLADDLGEHLGCGAHLSSLRRTATAGFEIAAAVTLDTLERCDAAFRSACLLPPDTLVRDLGRVDLDPHQMAQLLHGQAVPFPGLDAGASHRAYGEGRFLGIARMGVDGLLAPVRLVADPLSPPPEA